MKGWVSMRREERRKSREAADGRRALGLSLATFSGRDGNSAYCCCSGPLFSPHDSFQSRHQCLPWSHQQWAWLSRARKAKQPSVMVQAGTLAQAQPVLSYRYKNPDSASVLKQAKIRNKSLEINAIVECGLLIVRSWIDNCDWCYLNSGWGMMMSRPLLATT